MPSPETSNLWTQFSRYFKASGTFLPYLQISAPLDYSKVKNFYIRNCEGAREIVANHKDKDEPIEKYIDSAKRVIKINFDPLPSVPEKPTDSSNPEAMKAYKQALKARNDMLFDNDLILAKVIQSIPSPFFTLIYTSTTRGEISTNSSGPYQKYPLITDILRFTKIPENRDSWKKGGNANQHARNYMTDDDDDEDKPRNKGYNEDEFPARKMPLQAEIRQKQLKEKQRAMMERKKQEKNTWEGKLDEILTLELIFTCLGVCVFLAILVLVSKSFLWAIRSWLDLFSAKAQPDEKLKETERKEEEKESKTRKEPEAKSTGTKPKISKESSSTEPSQKLTHRAPKETSKQ